MHGDIIVKSRIINSDPFLASLTDPGMMWHGITPTGLLTGKLTIIAVEGAINDWAAYIETPSSGGDPFQIAKSGNKLSKKVASRFFPELDDTKYRD